MQRTPCSFLLALVTGCGPAAYGLKVTSKATATLEAARTAGAEKVAPYEFTMAEEYLHKAREEGSYSNYQNALYYGEQSTKMATSAQELVQKAGTQPAAAPSTPSTPSTPSAPSAPSAPAPHKEGPRAPATAPKSPEKPADPNAPPPGADEIPPPPKVP